VWKIRKREICRGWRSSSKSGSRQKRCTASRSSSTLQTFDADVARLEISAEVACTRERVVRQTVNDGRDANVTSPPTRTPRVELRPDVQLTSEVAVVDCQTAAETHATIMSRCDEHHLVVRLTTSDERLALAIFVYLASCCWNQTTSSSTASSLDASLLQCRPMPPPLIHSWWRPLANYNSILRKGLLKSPWPLISDLENLFDNAYHVMNICGKFHWHSSTK